MKDKPKKTKQSNQDKAQLWSQRYDIAKKNQQPMFDRFSKWFDLMYANINDTNMALWRSKVFIPVLASKAWSLISKFVGLKPGFEVSLRDPEPMPEKIPEELEDDLQIKAEYTKAENERIADMKRRAEKMQKKLEYDYDNPRLSEPIRDKLISPLVDAVVTGTGFAKVPWHVKDIKKYSRIIDDSGTVDLTKEQVIGTKYGCNDLIPINIFNMFIAPSATNLYDSPWVIIKEYKTTEELKKTKHYSNIDKLENSRAEADEFASQKRSRNRLVSDEDPIVSDNSVDFVAVYECYEGDMIYVYADAGTKNGNRMPWVELDARKNPYWHGKFPIVRFVVKQRPYSVWGEGLFEITERLQSAINDSFNHYMDNWNLSVDGMWLIEEGSNVDDFVIQPGGQIYYSGNAPQPAKIPEPNPQAIDLVNNYLAKAIEDSTISSYATGLPSSATDTTQGTATGIKRLQDAAGDIIGFMRSNFQQSIKQIGEMWLSNNQQFMDRNLVITDNSEPVKITPYDMQGDMDLRIDDASMESVSKEDQKNSWLAFLQQTLSLQQASLAQAQSSGIPPLELDYEELWKSTAEKFGIKSIDSIIVTPDEKEEQMQEQQAQQQGINEEMMPQEMQGEMPDMEQQPEMPIGNMNGDING